MKDSLGERIRSLRDTRGQSLKQLAEATGLTQSFLSQVERELTSPSVASLRKIADAKGVSVAQIAIGWALSQGSDIVPLVGARRLRLRYMTQVNTRPPSFALFASKPGELPESYRRYLVNALRHDFELPGTPIRIMLRKGDNPYAAS